MDHLSHQAVLLKSHQDSLHRICFLVPVQKSLNAESDQNHVVLKPFQV